MHKLVTLLIFVLSSPTLFSQDSLKVKTIDSLVAIINRSPYTIQQDTVVKEHPELGLSITNYLTAILDGRILKKYVNRGLTKNTQNGVTKEMITSSAFYYDQDKLIKVEEFAEQGEKSQKMDWYFLNDELIHQTFPSPKSAERAKLLITISASIQKGFSN